VLYCLNGGTSDENKASAAHCYSRLVEVATDAEAAIKNAGKLLKADEWLFGRLSDLSAKTKAFAERYDIKAI
jgi:hypothetical protein